LEMTKEGALSGTVSGKRGTTSIISGYLSADKFNFTINIPVQDAPADATFTGTFDGSSLKGSISVVGYSIDFTGTKPSVAMMAGEAFSGREGAAR
jgi:hypothetical protein